MLVLAMGLDEAPRLLNRLPPSDAQRVGAAVAALRPGMRSGILAGRVNLVIAEFLESVSDDADGAEAFMKRLFDGAAPGAAGRPRFGRLLGHSRVRLRLRALLRQSHGAAGRGAP
jgi:flagellar motor switch protein FliG